MDVDDLPRRDDEEVFLPPRPIGLVSDERTLLEGKMARDNLLDYLVRMQNSDYIGRHPRRSWGKWKTNVKWVEVVHNTW
jgi:hypothetical protein